MENVDGDDGYDSDLFEDADKASKFKCAICTCIVKDPVETYPCGHLYCKGCLSTYLKLNDLAEIPSNNANDTDMRCPSCREIIQQTLSSAFLQRQVNTLRVKCVHHDHPQGCEWSGELNYLQQHLSTKCDCVVTPCKHCKTHECARGKMEQHWSSECHEYPMECVLCHSRIARKSYERHTQYLCPDLMLQCPNACGESFKQSALAHHSEKECKLRRLPCLYAGYGCGMSPKFSDMQLHLSQHNVVHLELKVLYLERVTQSPELLAVTNTHGDNCDISGVYQREGKPHLARPIWRHRNNAKFVVRFDASLKAWVIDKTGFDGEVVAVRYGEYATPIATQLQSADTLQMEQLLLASVSPSDDALANALAAAAPANKQQSVDEEKSMEELTNDKDGAWRIVGKVQNSKITVKGYSEREFDLEWDIKSLSAQIKRLEHTYSGVIRRPSAADIVHAMELPRHENGGHHKHLHNVLCICGKTMIATKINPYGQNDSESSAVVCDVCAQEIAPNQDFLHCLAKRNSFHVSGYDLCVICGEARKQTQLLKTPSCDCGRELVAIMSIRAYPTSMGVSCNICGLSADGTGVIWHCSKKYSKAHEHGFDLCLECGKTYAPKKQGIMGWLTSAKNSSNNNT